MRNLRCTWDRQLRPPACSSPNSARLHRDRNWDRLRRNVEVEHRSRQHSRGVLDLYTDQIVNNLIHCLFQASILQDRRPQRHGDDHDEGNRRLDGQLQAYAYECGDDGSSDHGGRDKIDVEHLDRKRNPGPYESGFHQRKSSYGERRRLRRVHDVPRDPRIAGDVRPASRRGCPPLPSKRRSVLLGSFVRCRREFLQLSLVTTVQSAWSLPLRCPPITQSTFSRYSRRYATIPKRSRGPTRTVPRSAWTSVFRSILDLSICRRSPRPRATTSNPTTPN